MDNLLIVGVVVVAMAMGVWWFMSSGKQAPPSSIQGNADNEDSYGYDDERGQEQDPMNNAEREAELDMMLQEGENGGDNNRNARE